MLASDGVTASTFFATRGGTLYVRANGDSTFTEASAFTGSGGRRAVFGEAGSDDGEGPTWGVCLPRQGR